MLSFRWKKVSGSEEPNYTLDGHLYPFFTRILSGPEEIENNARSIERCPVLLQEYIEKRADIRVICIGREVFAFEIASQEHPLSIHDFRGVSPDLLRHAEHSLPCTLTEQILKFISAQGLQFAAIDLAWAVSGEYYFLENNPNGQWLWLEHCTGVPLTDAMLRLFFP